MPEAAEQPAAESADPLKAMTGRAGEATLSPVNTAAFDVPAPAGKGAWDTYSLQDEWVGEPMPIGTPIKTANPVAQSAPRPAQGFGQGFGQDSGQAMPQPAARDALSAAAVTGEQLQKLLEVLGTGVALASPAVPVEGMTYAACRQCAAIVPVLAGRLMPDLCDDCGSCFLLPAEESHGRGATGSQ